MFRRDIYYWKSDRPAAFHGVLRRQKSDDDSVLVASLHALLSEAFDPSIVLGPAPGEGSHRTYLLHYHEKTFLVRVEDGPEGDTQLAMEGEIMQAVAKTGVPVPEVLFCDVSRTKVPFSVQVIAYFPVPDLNRLARAGTLQDETIAFQIGTAMAKWQSVPVQGFGPFQQVDTQGKLIGFHASYATYFHLHLERHLDLLLSHQFLTPQETNQIRQAIKDHTESLQLSEGVLVHKDLSLWNILGSNTEITAFIDWDDAISGDPSDDFSLLACFHPYTFLQHAMAGYETVRPLPSDFSRRFSLHLLRNMIVKSVIRTCAGYFDQTQQNFLMPPGQDAQTFKRQTHAKLLRACHALMENRTLADL